MIYHPKSYQREAYQFGMDHPNCGLFLDMGLGKTVVVLSMIQRLLNECEIRAALVIAPLRVVQLVWRQEAKKWDHTRRLRISILSGSPSSREIVKLEKTITTKPNIDTLRTLSHPADIYLCNYDILPGMTEWIAEQKQLPFDMIVWDESSKMKSAKARRFKMMKPQLRRFNRSILMTGTPAPRSYMDLWSQIYLLDRGDRLTPFITHFRDRYFRQNPYNHYDWKLCDGAAEHIENKIGDITLSMKAEDYIDMPKLTFNTVEVMLPAKAMELYDEMEEDMLIQLEKGDVAALNAASVSSKCRQITSGAVYHEDKTWSEIHQAKLDALEEIIAGASSNPVLIAYEFKHEAVRILRRWNKCVHIGNNKTRVEDIVEQWNDGEIPLLLAHPASFGHGINLQAGGHILVFTSGTWDAELYEQMYKRLYRQGQQQAVVVHSIICRNTVDIVVQKSLREKITSQDGLLQALRAYRDSSLLSY